MTGPKSWHQWSMLQNVFGGNLDFSKIEKEFIPKCESKKNPKTCYFKQKYTVYKIVIFCCFSQGGNLYFFLKMFYTIDNWCRTTFAGKVGRSESILESDSQKKRFHSECQQIQLQRERERNANSHKRHATTVRTTNKAFNLDLMMGGGNESRVWKMLRRNKSDSGEIGLLHRWRCNGVVSLAASVIY